MQLKKISGCSTFYAGRLHRNLIASGALLSGNECCWLEKQFLIATRVFVSCQKKEDVFILACSSHAQRKEQFFLAIGRSGLCLICLADNQNSGSADQRACCFLLRVILSCSSTDLHCQREILFVGGILALRNRI